MEENKNVEVKETAQAQVPVENKAVALAPTKYVTDFSLGIFGSSDNFTMATQMAKALSQSSIVPAPFQGNVANAVVAIEISQRLNTSPLMVMQNLNVIQGRPSWSSQFLIAMVNGSGKYDMELQYDEVKDKNGKPFSCTAWTTRNGRRIDGITVDMDMATAEGWVTKNGSKWKTLPALMLRYRAAAFFARLNCPEIALGFYTQEELRDSEFKEYPAEDLKAQVEREISASANSVDFMVDAQ